MKIQEKVAPTPPPIPAPAPLPICEVVDGPNGGLYCTIYIQPDAAKRHKARAGTMDLSRYLWENILKRAITDSVY